MRTRPLALLLLSLLLVSIAALPPIAYFRYVERSVTTYLLAIKEGGGGVAIRITIGLSPGSGNIFVMKGTLGNDTITALEISAIYASIITGNSYRKYDYLVWIDGDVSGLSATLLFTLMLTLALSGRSGVLDFSATGIVGPGGIVGRVSGVYEKLEAAKSVGLKAVFVPFDVREDNFTISAYTIYDAAERAAGIALCDTTGPTGYSPFEDILKEAYANYTRDIAELLKSIDFANTSHITTRLEDAERAYNTGKYYAATTLAFQAYTWALYAYLSSLRGGNYSAAVRALRNELSERGAVIGRALMDLVEKASEKGADVYAIDLLYSVYYRLNEALLRLDAAGNTSEREEADLLLAYSAARMRTAENWLKIAEKALGGSASVRGHVLAPDELSERTEALRGLIDLHIAQLRYMLKEGPSFSGIGIYPKVGIGGPLGGLLELMYTWTKLSEIYYEMFSSAFPNMTSATVARMLLATFSCVSQIPGDGAPLSLITLGELLAYVFERATDLTGWETALYSHLALATAYRLITLEEAGPFGPTQPSREPWGTFPINALIILAAAAAAIAVLLIIVIAERRRGRPLPTSS